MLKNKLRVMLKMLINYHQDLRYLSMFQLLKKLIYYKFDAQSLNWIKSYLSNRKQHIVHKNVKSTSQTVTQFNGKTTCFIFYTKGRVSTNTVDDFF